MNRHHSRLFLYTHVIIGLLVVVAIVILILALMTSKLGIAILSLIAIVLSGSIGVILQSLKQKLIRQTTVEPEQSDLHRMRELQRMRSDFVANVSHELKTPVAAVKGFAETLLSGAMNDKETAEQFLHIIYDESERLDRLIGDLTELSKIESGRSPLHFSPLNVGEVLSDVLRIMQSMARDKNITLNMEAEEMLYIEADEDRLRQILFNLVSNGIHYTMDGGKVNISAQAVKRGDEDRICLVVTDTGIGIPEKDLPRIFERFYRVDKARSRRSGGTGLGLSIVKHLVELHKGTIHAESESGQGTKFIIDLPILQS